MTDSIELADSVTVKGYVLNIKVRSDEIRLHDLDVEVFEAMNACDPIDLNKMSLDFYHQLQLRYPSYRVAKPEISHTSERKMFAVYTISNTGGIDVAVLTLSKA